MQNLGAHVISRYRYIRICPLKKQVCSICYTNESFTVHIPMSTFFDDKEVQPIEQARATSYKVSGTQAQTLQNTKSSSIDYILFFNRGFLSNYQNPHPKTEFYHMCLHKCFSYIGGSPNLHLFVFWFVNGRFEIAWLV